MKSFLLPLILDIQFPHNKTIIVYSFLGGLIMMLKMKTGKTQKPTISNRQSRELTKV
jgi:hypothetical protein